MSATPIDGIICLGGDPWGEMKRPGQMMLQLARYAPIVYIEPHLGVASVIKNWRTALSPMARARLRRVLARHTMVAPGVHVVSPLALLPLHRMTRLLPSSVITRLSTRQYAHALRKARKVARELGMREPAMWVSYPAPLDSLREDGWSRVIYDCMDRWTDFPDTLADDVWRAQVRATEQTVLDRAEVVLCSAEGLYQAQRDRTQAPVLLVRNGADVGHFAPTGRDVPTDVAALPRPLIGYVGAVAEWVDFELVREVALARPEWSFVLVGPVFKGRPMGDPRLLDHITDLPNVHLLGMRPYDRLPAYLEAFDVATIPFKINGLTEDTSPIKVYEYLAAGLPVVSTPLPEVDMLGEVRVAASATDFIRACEAGIRERHDPDAIARRIASAAENSWSSRAHEAWLAMVSA